MQYDVIVIGVGGMGSAAVYQLARRGCRVLGLEQFSIPHENGSSHGVNRIIRLAYAEHPDYVPLLRRAYELWWELENLAQERLLIITGGIDAGAKDSLTVAGSLLACEKHHLPHQLLTAAELHKRFPGYRLPDDMVAVYQPDGGFVLSERSIVNYVLAALSHGAEVHAHEKVISWEPADGGVKVLTNRGSYWARRVVITAGPWAASLIPTLTQAAVPERQVLLWAHPLRPDLFRLGVFPVFNLEASGEDGPPERFYGLPMYGVPGFKIGKYHHRREQANPDRVDRDIHDEDERVLREGIRRFFPDADGPTMALKTCLFTNSPDEHFILDLHPDVPEIAIAAGFSGHGFKFCSVVGEILADLVLQGETRHDIGLFRIDRPALNLGLKY
jgi:sarcosine oxidase